jgi:ribosomal RNA-processing protein 9
LSTFTQHRDAVSAVKFRRGQNQLYTASFDRTIKVWNIDEMSYLDTMFGHQDVVCHMDTLQRERCLTAGARDRSARLWKIAEETQLVFRGGGGGLDDDAGEAKKRVQNAFGGSLDVVCMLNEDYFISGSDNGALSLWSVGKKKPVFTRLRAHGVKEHHEIELDPHFLATVEGEEGCNWITALAALPYSDLFASGSSDGFIKLWQVDPSFKSFSLITSIPVKGFINDLRLVEVSQDLDSVAPIATTAAQRREAARQKMDMAQQIPDAPILHLMVAVGHEHRFGRWFKVKGAKNHVSHLILGPIIKE